MDEVWSFIGKKKKRVRPEDDQNMGDCCTFVAIERHSKLVLNIAIGKRNQQTTDVSVEGVRHATAHTPFEVTTDGFVPYRSAIVTTLHDRLTGFAQLIKVYRTLQDGEKRYSPAEVQSVEVVPVYGQPDPERICTSIVERSNLSLRMGVRRFIRLTDAFSKKWENQAAAVMLWFAFYNFCRVHKSLKVTPAMQAGISDHIWSVRVFMMCLAKAKLLPTSQVESFCTPALFVAYLFGLGVGAMEIMILMQGTLLFGSVAFLLDLLIPARKKRGTQI